MSTEQPILAAANLRLVSEGPPSAVRPVQTGSSVRLTAAPGADLFLDPAGSATPPDAERFVQVVEGDFQFSARVEVDFRADFDSGVLLGYADHRNWFKICAELDPDGTRRVVTVVTRNGASDDANSWAIEGTGIHLRISRTGQVFGLHASIDGRIWSMIRYFLLAKELGNSLNVGILAQSPVGSGTSALFSNLALTPATLADMRSGV